MCRAYEVGRLELFDSGQKESCATFMIIRCNSCDYSRSFWSVSGAFGKSSLSVSDSKIRMRNDMVYSSILGGRLVGIGLEKLSLYHATLNIPSPPYRNILYKCSARYSSWSRASCYCVVFNNALDVPVLSLQPRHGMP